MNTTQRMPHQKPRQRMPATRPEPNTLHKRWTRLLMRPAKRTDWVALCLVVLLGGTSHPASADAPLVPTVEHFGAGTLMFRTAPGVFETATRLDTDVQMNISGIVARVKVQQRFHNDGSDWVEGIYMFPLPDDAAVDRLTMYVGERIIVGEIKEREEARKTYEQAKQSGRRASLVEQERPNMFTMSVANIGPGDQITVEIEYQQTVAYDNGRFSLRFPMTITPRYIPGTVMNVDPEAQQGHSWSYDTTRVPDASRITPPVLHPASTRTNPVSLRVTVDAGLALTGIESRYHVISVVRSGTRYELSLANSNVSMDRDFELSWSPVVGESPEAVVFNETLGAEHYVLVMFVPPKSAEVGHAQPRELIFVVDTSGSMAGASIVQAKASLDLALSRLNDQDRFNVIQFNSFTHALFHAPVPATLGNRAAARAYVDGLAADGGTEMAPALSRALDTQGEPGYLKQVIFITDGSVGNEAELFGLIRKRLGNTRLFTVGIGSAPNSHFMRKAAQFGRGTFTHIGRVDEVETKMYALFEKLERPALTGIEIAWPSGTEAWPQRVPDLYAGEPVVVAAKLKRGHSLDETEISGVAAGLVWKRGLHATASQHPGVAGLWARRKIETLMDSRIEGASEDEIRPSVVDVALKHHLVSRYTSLVAVDKTPARSMSTPLKSEAVPNMLPVGADFNAIFGGFPPTATPAALHLLLGIMLLLAAFVLAGSERISWRHAT